MRSRVRAIVEQLLPWFDRGQADAHKARTEAMRLRGNVSTDLRSAVGVGIVIVVIVVLVFGFPGAIAAFIRAL